MRLFSVGRGLCVAAAVVVAFAPVSRTPVSALGPRPLGAGDFFGGAGAKFLTNDNTPNYKIAGQAFKTVIDFDYDLGQISFNPHLYPSYNAITFGFGISDNLTGASGTIEVQDNGKTIRTYKIVSQREVQHATIPLTGHGVLTFIRHEETNGDVLMTDPTLIVAGSPTPSAPSVIVATGSVMGGGQQTIDTTTVPGKMVTDVVIYRSGAHLISGPHRAGPTGHDIFTFTVPTNVPGKAEVFVIVQGVGTAQTTFVVS